MTVRARRLDNEWALLGQLAERNPKVVEAVRRETAPDAEIFHVIVHRTSALALAPPHELMEFASHPVRFRFPEYYPSVPIEAFLEKPLFHPNIHPDNGFVCLWDRFSSGDTVVEAVRKLQKVIAWELWNQHAEHVMQPDAVAHPPVAVLPAEIVRVPGEPAPPSRAGAPYRRRLIVSP
ncbi:MAG TPA: hypothetical protein VMB85_07945 [Bryobacteraceae bacterium]|nr:hypothetical protein [Bryobacteraceae bacterium]